MSGHLPIRIWLLAFLAPGFIGSLPVAAERDLGHAGKIGQHALVDSLSAPGATCRFAPPLVWSLGETWIQVRPPVIFARDATALEDEQLVGWRAVILNEDRASGKLTTVATGEIQRAVASEVISAPFESRAPASQFHLGYGAYLVRVELFWYEGLSAGNQPKLVGQASYEVQHFAIIVRHRTGIRQDGVSDACLLSP